MPTLHGYLPRTEARTPAFTPPPDVASRSLGVLYLGLAQRTGAADRRERRSVQVVVDLLDEGRGIEGLGDEVVGPGVSGLLRLLEGQGSHDEDGNLRALALEQRDQSKSGNSRNHQVDGDQRGVLAIERLHCLQTVGDDGYRIPRGSQVPADDLGDLRIVLHDEDSLGPMHLLLPLGSLSTITHQLGKQALQNRKSSRSSVLRRGQARVAKRAGQKDRSWKVASAGPKVPATRGHTRCFFNWAKAGIYHALPRKGPRRAGGEHMGREQPRRWTGQVLVVEDDPDLRELIQNVLAAQGVTVETAEDGQKAAELIEEWCPSLVLLDRELPILNGVAVAARVHATHGDDAQIVAMTAASSAAEFAREIGAVDYLQKPFDIDHLIALVRRLVPAARSDELLVG